MSPDIGDSWTCMCRSGWRSGGGPVQQRPVRSVRTLDASAWLVTRTVGIDRDRRIAEIAGQWTYGELARPAPTAPA